MSLNKLLIAVIFAAAVSRLLPHPPNFAPIAGLALFGGSYLPKKYALIFPLSAMFISDLFLGFHSAMAWVYVSFILITLIGSYFINHKSMSLLPLFPLHSCFLFLLTLVSGFPLVCTPTRSPVYSIATTWPFLFSEIRS